MSAAVSLPKHLPVVTNTELKTFRRCAREWKYAYKLRRRPIRRAESLRFGTLIHHALEAWWRAPADPNARLGAALAAIGAHVGEAECDAYDRVDAEELMLGYTARWGDDLATPTAVEAQFDAPLVNPATGAESRTYRLSGKLDVVFPDRYMEHKTTSVDIELGGDYWENVTALDAQVSMYKVGARALGVDGPCTYDVIRKVSLRPKRATPVEKRQYTKTGSLYANQREHDETPDEYRARVRENIAENPARYYARGDLVRLAHDDEEHGADVWWTARSMREAELQGRYPRNPDACIRYGRRCEYFEVCSGRASIDDDTRFRTAPDAHEELMAAEEVTF